MASVPGHLMIGGTYKADYHPESGTFTPALNTEAHLNVTYNYGQYYKEVYEKGNELVNVLVFLKQQVSVKEEIIEYEVDEGDTSDYWLATAANAIRPLHQLIALTKMRPDCIWDGD